MSYNQKPARGEPIFKTVFGQHWENLPPVMRSHYAVRPFSHDAVQLNGTLDVRVSPLVSLMARLTGMLVRYSGRDVPVTVILRSGKETEAFHFDRTFHFPDKGDVTFRSRMKLIKRNELVEIMRFGLGWKMAYSWDGTKVILKHRGYVWCVLGLRIPVPLELLLGKGHAEETPVSDDTFSMWTHVDHPLFGKTFGYAGTFTVTGSSCDPS